MTDYISREAAIEALNKVAPKYWQCSEYGQAQANQFGIDKLAILSVPAADLAPLQEEIVHCKDCAYRMENNGYCRIMGILKGGWEVFDCVKADPDCFCSWGKRKGADDAECE